MKTLARAFSQFVFTCSIFLISLSGCTYKKAESEAVKKEEPKIVNIINFIRLLEPRDAEITEDVLFQTVVKQVEMMKKYQLGGTFLLQYDALIDSRYQELLKSLPADSFEIGGWWEIPQPLVENAGMTWKGRFPWDWHADVGFSTGYVPEEREKLVDLYMEDFKKIFGDYPKSVGSWFIDAHTLNYMYKKYGIVASCNCKDQVGTDGYTMWGGYWNQAYYPSKINSYMPAQNEENQIPVPIFRMLGSDPIRQYDHGLGRSRQGVVSLEPVYKGGGGDSAWVHWYFKNFIDGEAMEFAYVQAGQENSFTWNAMQKGFEIQMPLIARLRDENKVKVETLAQSGEWFKANYKTTPATSVTVTEDLNGGTAKTVWFNSRFYRVNLLWENENLRIRDIHLFDEKLPSKYLTKRVNSNECSFFTLPFVDGYMWSTPDKIAGLRFKTNIGGKEILLEGENPVITNPVPGKLHISWPLKSFDANLVIEMDEHRIEIKTVGRNTEDWFLDLTSAEGKELPFREINSTKITSEFEGINYTVTAQSGTFSKPNADVDFRISPEKNTIVLEMVK